MVGDDIDDDLDTVIIRLFTKRLKLGFCSKPCCAVGYAESERLIELLPLAALVGVARGIILRLLYGRGLYSGIACRGDGGKIGFDIIV